MALLTHRLSDYIHFCECFIPFTLKAPYICCKGNINVAVFSINWCIYLGWGGGGGWYLTKFYMGRLHTKVQHLTLHIPFFERKGTPFVYQSPVQVLYYAVRGSFTANSMLTCTVQPILLYLYPLLVSLFLFLISRFVNWPVPP